MMVKVLFVCMGNICRSPTAEGVFEHLVQQYALSDQVEIDSAGTHAYHIGEPPDRRAQESALNRGINLSTQRARRVQADDFEYYDYVLAMDNDNLAHLIEICPSGQRGKVELFLKYAAHAEEQEVPDPYYGAAEGFERVLDMIESASDGLLEDIRQRHLSPIG